MWKFTISLSLACFLSAGLIWAMNVLGQAQSQPNIAKQGLVSSVDELDKKLRTTPPIGTILAFGGRQAPGGYLICDGAEVNRQEYSALFEVLGEIWGKGDGNTTFKIPDLRGEFLRGADNMGPRRGSANVDPNHGRKVGTPQGDALKDHHHTIPSLVQAPGNVTSLLRDNPKDRQNIFYSNNTHNNAIPTKDHATRNLADQTSMAPSVSTETRPQNVAVLFIIKAK